MEKTNVGIGSRVCIVSYGPFRGLKGVIKSIYSVNINDNPMRFYLIDVEIVSLQEPVWFQDEEVEIIS